MGGEPVGERSRAIEWPCFPRNGAHLEKHTINRHLAVM